MSFCTHQLSVITDNTNNLTLEQESDSGDWWISIPTEVSSTSMVSFERIDTDLDIEVRVETRYRILAPRVDFIIPAIFGILGMSAIIGGLFITYRMDRRFAKEAIDDSSSLV